MFTAFSLSFPPGVCVCARARVCACACLCARVCVCVMCLHFSRCCCLNDILLPMNVSNVCESSVCSSKTEKWDEEWRDATKALENGTDLSQRELDFH